MLKNMEQVLTVPNGTDFHLGTGRGISIRELAEMIEGEYGKNAISIGEGVHIGSVILCMLWLPLLKYAFDRVESEDWY